MGSFPNMLMLVLVSLVLLCEVQVRSYVLFKLYFLSLKEFAKRCQKQHQEKFLIKRDVQEMFGYLAFLGGHPELLKDCLLISYK